MDHKDQQVLQEELEAAQKQVKIGGTYSHYKNPDKLYEVIALGVQELNDKLCVVYQAKYGKKIIFIRDLDSWLKEPLKGTPRFRFIR